MYQNETDYYYESNPLPIVIHHTDDRVSLNTAESNYHIWSVSYNVDRLYLDISHGVTDGTAMYMVLSTLLFYYCNERYGVTDSTGIRTLEDEITPEETIDPYDLVPMLDPSQMPKAGLDPAFSLAEDTGLTPCEPQYVHGAAAVSASRIKMVKQMAPTVEAKKQAYAKMLDGSKRLFTYMVSYIGQWKQTQLGPYVLELWTHVPDANNLLTEIAAINGKVFLSIHRNFKEDDVIKAFLARLDENGIAYSVKGTEKLDNAYLPEPD